MHVFYSLKLKVRLNKYIAVQMKLIEIHLYIFYSLDFITLFNQLITNVSLSSAQD